MKKIRTLIASTLEFLAWKVRPKPLTTDVFEQNYPRPELGRAEYCDLTSWQESLPRDFTVKHSAIECSIADCQFILTRPKNEDSET